MNFCLSNFRLGYDVSTITSTFQNYIYADNYDSIIGLNNPRVSRRFVVGYDKYFKNSFGLGIESYIGNGFIDLGFPESFNSIKYENFSFYLSYYTPKIMNIEAFVRYGSSSVSMHYGHQEFEDFIVSKMGSQGGPMYGIGININNLQLSFSSYTNTCYVHLNNNQVNQIRVIDFEVRRIQASYIFKKR